MKQSNTLDAVHLGETVEKNRKTEATLSIPLELARENDPRWVIAAFGREIPSVCVAAFLVRALLLEVVVSTFAMDTRLSMELALVAD